MITHIVCWRYKPETTEDQRSEHIALLRALPGLIPDIESFSVGADVLRLDRSFDTGLVAIYRDMDALDAYTNHAEHQKVAAIGREISQQVVSVDFENENGSGPTL